MKLILIGWDGVHWRLIRQLLEQGVMPRLQQFLSDAVSGELQPVRPFNSASLWTSIATGKRATAHGVLAEVEPDLAQMRMRPVSRRTLTARPVWSILSNSGYRSHALGWPASHPAASINGVVVTDRFAEELEEGCVNPSSLVNLLGAWHLTPTDVDAASIVGLLPRAAQLNPADQRLYLVAQFLASTASLHAAATWILENEPWDFVTVRYAALARLVNVLGPTLAASQAGQAAADAALFGELLPNAYRFFDMLFGRLIELAGSDASLMIVSEQGGASHGAATSACPRPEPGIVIAAGPAFKSSRHLGEASVCDVAPTILNIFSLPPDPGSHGNAWSDVLSNAVAAAAVVTVPDASLGETPQTVDLKVTLAPDDGAISHLVALGYQDRPDEYFQLAARQLDEERTWRLADAWLDEGGYAQAASLLERLIAAELPPRPDGGAQACTVQLSKPHVTHYRSMLAETYFRAGDYEACRRLVLALQADGVSTPLSEVALAAMDFAEGRPDAAAEHLAKAETIDGASAGVLEIMGRLYLRLRRPSDSARAFDAALALDATLYGARHGRALTCLLDGDPLGAERHAREAIKLQPQSPNARRHLGLALARQDRLDEAIGALQDAVALDPGDAPAAHQQLAELFKRRGQLAVAAHHSALFDRRGAAARRPPLDYDWFNGDWVQ